MFCFYFMRISFPELATMVTRTVRVFTCHAPTLMRVLILTVMLVNIIWMIIVSFVSITTRAGTTCIITICVVWREWSTWLFCCYHSYGRNTCMGRDNRFQECIEWHLGARILWENTIDFFLEVFVIQLNVPQLLMLEEHLPALSSLDYWKRGLFDYWVVRPVAIDILGGRDVFSFSFRIIPFLAIFYLS